MKALIVGLALAGGAAACASSGGSVPPSASDAPALLPPLAAAPLADSDFVLIHPGTFVMGDSVDLTVHSNRPPHEVTLTRAFYIQKTEVTQAQWQYVMHNNPSVHANCPACPVENVTYKDVVAFVQRLNGDQNEHVYRLPTEAEWEYAARAGTTGNYGTGADVQLGGWIKGNSGGTTHPVAQLAPNAWGLYDMEGNVEEWVHDWFTRYSAGADTDRFSPRGGDRGGQVIHGGSFEQIASYARSANRVSRPQATHAGNIGFRLAHN